jgi:FtsP/CotA-like multicopper oxidase with cupredoxin domain
MLCGLYGFIDIVGSDDHITTVPEIAEATEVFLMLGESALIPETTDPNVFLPVVFDFSWRHVTNGHYGDDTVFTFKTGETVLFRAAGAGIEPVMPLSIDEHMLWLIANDGFPVTELAATDILELHAGARMEFMVKFDKPGNYTFRRNPFNFGKYYNTKELLVASCSRPELFSLLINGCMFFYPPHSPR